MPRVTLLRRQSLDKVDKVLKSFRSDGLRNATAAGRYLYLSPAMSITNVKNHINSADLKDQNSNKVNTYLFRFAGQKYRK